MEEIWKIKITSDKVTKEKKEKNNISMAFPSSKLKKGNFTRKDCFSKCLFNTIFFFFTLYQKRTFL